MKKQKMDFEQQIRFIKSKILELKATGEYSDLAIIFNEDFTKSKEILENILFYGLDDELAEKDDLFKKTSFIIIFQKILTK